MIPVLIDESVHLKTAAKLRDLGISAIHLVEAGLGGMSDKDVLAEASERGAVLVSHDSDFHKLLAQSGATQPSVIRLRTQTVNPQVIAELVFAVLSSMEQMIQDGAAISADLSSIRARHLPLR